MIFALTFQDVQTPKQLKWFIEQAMCILNTEGCNILENLSEKEYTECLDLIRDNILATDMADHLR